MGWGLMLISWGLLGLSYWAALEAMGIPGLDPIAQLPRYTASVSLAMDPSVPTALRKTALPCICMKAFSAFTMS